MQLLLAVLLALAAVHARGIRIWRYESGEDVTEHTKIDLDVQALETFAEAEKYAQAYALWAEGANSRNDDGSLRTLKGFSTGLVAKAESLQTYNSELLSEFPLFTTYYDNDETYGTTFVEHALNGTGFFASMSAIARAEYIAKGVQYQVMHMYILRELYESVRTCLQGGVSVKAWDEGVAFYTGSLIKPDGTGSGKLWFTFAQKRCGFSGTCNAAASNAALVNERAFAAFIEGKAAVEQRRCADIQAQVLVIRKMMQVSLVQGTLQYALKSDAEVSPAEDVKAMAEAWAFLAALLPYIDEVDSDAAADLRSELEFTSNVTQTVRGRYRKVFETMHGVLPKLCMSCEEVGSNNMVHGGAIPQCVTDAEALEQGCADYLQPLELPPAEDEEGLDKGLVIGIAVGALILAALLLGGVWHLSKKAAEGDKKKRQPTPQRVDPELKTSSSADNADVKAELQQV